MEWGGRNRAFLLAGLMTLSMMSATPQSPREFQQSESAHIWCLDAVDQGNATFNPFPSIVTDSADIPHISFITHSNPPLAVKYSFVSGENWSVRNVEAGPQTFGFTSIDLDSLESPSIAFVNKSDQVLMYASFTDPGWVVESVDTFPVTNAEISLKLDSADNPHISYGQRDYGLRHAALEDGHWNLSGVIDAHGGGRSNAIDIDQSNRPHIAYMGFDQFEWTVNYTHYDGTSWVKEKVEAVTWPFGISISLDSNGVPHIAYADSEDDILKHAYRTETGWVIESVDHGEFSIGVSSLDISSEGEPHIAYYDTDGENLRHAYLDEGTWTNETVDSDGDTGRTMSLAVDANGRPQIAYWDATAKDVNYAIKGACPWDTTNPPISDAGGPYEALEGDAITFDASGSTGPEGVPLEYRWDFDGDGLWDTPFSNSPYANHTWHDDHAGTAYVEVKGPGGLTRSIEIIGTLGGSGFVQGQEQRGQEFVATFDTLTHVVVDVTRHHDEIPDAPLVLAIRSGINEPDLVTAQVDGSGLPKGFVENWVDFDVPDLGVTRNQTYFVVLYTSAQNAGYEPHSTMDAYAGGTAWAKGPGGNWSPSEYTDYRAIIHGIEGTTSDVDDASVTVHNVAPTPEWTSQSSDGTILNPPYPEGKEILFEATVDDPGIYDTFTYDWDFGDWTILLDGGPSVTHTYGDNDIHIVVLTVTDDDGGIGIDDTPPLETTNENPVASISMPFCIFTEGTAPCAPKGDFSDPGWLDTHAAVWNFGDGTYETAVLMEENDPPDATGWNITSHVYGDNGAYTIMFTVTDDDGGVGSASAEAQVINLPPTLEMNSPLPVNEGEDFVLEITVTDPGSDDIILTIEWGDGTSETMTYYNDGVGPDRPNSGEGIWPFTVTASLTHVYGDNGNFTVQVTAEDDDGDSVQDSTVAELLNLPPEIMLLAVPLSINEGEEFSIVAEATDPGSDDIEFDWTFELGPYMSTMYYNDGIGSDPPMSPWGVFPFTAEDTATHMYGDNGIYEVTIVTTDDDGGASTMTFTIEVTNVAPSVDIGGPYWGDENSAIEFTATAVDPGSDDLTLIWDWGDGTTEAIAFYNDGMSDDPPKSPWGTHPFEVTHTVSHTWGDNGDFIVTLTATDDDSGVTVKQTVVTVNNVAPTIAGISYYLNASFAFRIAGEKWHDVEIYLYEDGTEVGYASITRFPGSPNEQMVALGEFSIDFSKTYSAVAYCTPEDDPINGQIWGATPAWVIIEYEDGEERIHHTFNVRHEDTWTWMIDDFSPYFLGHNITFMATASDPGSDDLTFSWDWGDGNTTENVYYNDGVGLDPYPSPEVNPITATDTAKHAYASAGTYTITLTVTDDDGGVTTYSLNLTP